MAARVDAIPIGRDDTRPACDGAGAALSPCANGDPLPRRRDHRHGLAIPARHRAGEGAHRLRHVPGQPERVDPEPHPVRLRPRRARRDPADPRPSRPLRAAPAAGQGRATAGPIHATAGTVELAALVLLDSGKLHEEFAKRDARWEKRHPDEVAADDREEARPVRRPRVDARRGGRDGEAGCDRTTGGEHVPTTIEPVAPADRSRATWPTRPGGRAARPAAAARGRPRRAALHGQGRRTRRSPQFRPLDYGEERRGRARGPRHVRRRRPHPRLGDHPAARHRTTTAARSASSSFPATWAGRARRSCATRRR